MARPSKRRRQDLTAELHPRAQGVGAGHTPGDAVRDATGDGAGHATGDAIGDPTGDGAGHATGDAIGDPTGCSAADTIGRPLGGPRGEPGRNGQDEPTGTGAAPGHRTARAPGGDPTGLGWLPLSHPAGRPSPAMVAAALGMGRRGDTVVVVAVVVVFLLVGHSSPSKSGLPSPDVNPLAPASVLSAVTGVSPDGLQHDRGRRGDRSPPADIRLSGAAHRAERPPRALLPRRRVLPLLRRRALERGDRPQPLRDLQQPAHHHVRLQPAATSPTPTPSPSTAPATPASTWTSRRSRARTATTTRCRRRRPRSRR